MQQEIKVRILAEQFFDEQVKMIADAERKEEVQLEAETYIGVWMRGFRFGEQHPAGSNVWVKASANLPLHKAFWNMPGKHNNNECYFPVLIDGHKYRVAEIFDNREKDAPDPIYYFVINGEDYFEKDFHRIEWLDESNEQPVEQKENEAVEFAEWLMKNKYQWYVSGQWSLNDRYAGTTNELYNEYQKQNKQ